MSASKEGSGSKSRLGKLLYSSRSPRPEAPAAAAPVPPTKPAAVAPFGRDPRLGKYVSASAFNRPEGVGVQEVLRALAEAQRSTEKAGRQALAALLLRLFYFEELPPEAVVQLMPLFQAQGKDVRTLRSLFHIVEAYVSPGSAGTPTLYDPALLGKRPDERALQAVLGEVWRLLESPGMDPAVARAAFFVAAAAARGSSAVRKQLATAVQRAIAEADEAATGALPVAKLPRRRSAATDWDLQHTVFAASRVGGTATGSDEISRSFGVGVASGDAVGARHALAMGAEVAFRDASYVVRELFEAVAEAAQQYEASGPGPLRVPGQGVNLEDDFGRLYLARLCANVVQSDQSATDVSRDGAPYWRMLCLLATRDPSDMVRFGAIEAMTGALAAFGPGASTKQGTAREDTVQRQRRGRAWRLLVAQSGLQVTIPSASDKPPVPGQPAAPPPTMKLVDVLGRLLLLALRKTGAAARFCVAAGAVASLAESCLASQTVGSTRHGSSPDMDRVLGVLAGELGGLVEGNLRPAERCAGIEVLLYLQAAGYATTFSPAKLVQATGAGGAWTGGMQDALLTAVLKCARAKPREAARFLGYAAAVVGISPSGIDLAKITDLWDAAVASGREGRDAVLAAVTEALHSPPPPSTQPRAGGGGAEVTRAARDEDGWNAFVSTAAWWLGEHANALCEEYCGRQLVPPKGVTAGGGVPPPAPATPPGAEGSQAGEDDEDGSEDEEADAASAAAVATAAASAADLIQAFGGRSPTLSRIMLALQDLMLTAVWQLRLAAAQALAKVAVRSGEPYRLQCYSILASAAGAGSAGDALGLGPAVRPALALLDRLYAAQLVLDQLHAEHGEDVDAWPKPVIASLARRNAELTQQAERYVCSVPRERYSLLGHRAALALSGENAEAGDYFSSFLRSALTQQEASSDKLGEQLVANKSREVDAILGSTASDEGGSLTFKAFSEKSAATLDDRDKEIDRLLSGGGALQAASDPWGTFGASASASYNAFAESGEAAVATGTGFVLASPSQQEASTPTFGGGIGAGGSGDWGGAARAASPEAGAGNDWFGNSGAAEQAARGGKAIGTGTVLHTFVGDYNQPEELSVFEGDKVEVLEEADGWMLVRDPSGREGLVPTSYLHLDQLYQQNLLSAAAAEAAAAAAEYQRKAAGTPTRAHRRGASVDFGQSKEDLLDNIFSSYAASPPGLPTMPEEQPASFGGGASLFEASSTYSAYSAPPPAAPSPGVEHAAGSGGSLSPVARQDSFSAPTGRTDSMWASQPLRQDSTSRSDYAEGASPRNGLGRQATNAAGMSPTQRSPSSVHRRTFSGASGGSGAAAAAAFDAYADLGSIPSTPSRVEGPERSIVAGFAGEMEGELSVEPGDRIKVHSEVDGWVRVIRLSDNRTGLVPSWALFNDVYLNALGVLELVENIGTAVQDGLGMKRRPATSGLQGKTAIVTGGNAGVGYATAQALVAAGANVVLACRSAERGAAAAAALAAATRTAGGGSVEVEALDLASLESARAFVRRWRKAGRDLDLLICNAGIMTPPDRVQTADGFELQWQSNYLSHFALVNSLATHQRWRRAQQSEGGRAGRPLRVIMLTSMTHFGGDLSPEQLPEAPFCRRAYRPFQAYANSKLATLLTAKHLDRLFAAAAAAAGGGAGQQRHHGVRDAAVAVHPGLVDTALARGYFKQTPPRLLRPLTDPFFDRLFCPYLLRSPAAAAETVLYAATAPADEVGGQYVGTAPRVSKHSQAAGDAALAARLWELSAHMCSLDADERVT
ncbi:short-chain dehydrogenase [Micractinium conductrix]|uniref:Short-chain dehydrogenase n=1 Tax=Micractinium conductrix TaxID=554055 RepID=A0A2P6VPT9_9CHLO|nr:short-chain dehydrogenase [Micractinium conductrix]|eukprot:PSC76102.1 short-chain dehydrogenase [Micractinium conductrix]